MYVFALVLFEIMGKHANGFLDFLGRENLLHRVKEHFNQVAKLRAPRLTKWPEDTFNLSVTAQPSPCSSIDFKGWKYKYRGLWCDKPGCNP